MSKLLIFIGILMICTACEIIYSYEYVIRNDTSHQIRIEGNDRIKDLYDNVIEDELINLNPHSNYSVFKEMGFHADEPGIFQSNQIDSVTIIFDDQKIIVQYCQETSLRFCYNIDRNIMAIETDNYLIEKTGRQSGENEYRFTYTITEEDYNNAVVIEK